MSDDLGRFSGTIARIGPEYGFILMDDNACEIFFHHDICESHYFETLHVGDRLRFSVQESKTHPGSLVPGRISREPKVL